MKTILVTGGAGFIGSNFIQHIFQKYPDYSIIMLDALTYAGNIENISPEIRDSERFEFWYGNLNNLDLVTDLVERSQIIVHFAAETHVARSLYLNRVFFITDVLGTQSVANAILKHLGTVERFIHISTSEVYGTALTEPMDEEHPLNPTSPYAAAKTGADRLVYSYIKSYDIPGVIIRPFNNYGPRQHLEKVIPRFITSAILGEPFTVHGDGSAARDWVHVSDTADAVDKAMHCPIEKIRGEVFNVGTGRSINVLEIAGKILGKYRLDSGNLNFMEERFGQVQNHIASVEKADKLLGFRAAINFEEGLENTIKWYNENRRHWEQQVLFRHVPVKTRDGSVIWY
jgi:dTDP-glucose 4,6-dehydratase